VCFGQVVVEVKARFGVGAAEQAQVLSYLASTQYQCGLLLNFEASQLDYRRFILTNPR
jgi:GxxExxY protein